MKGRHGLSYINDYPRCIEVKSPPRLRLSPVSAQILAYLRRHRRAQDTLEGIAEWWMLEQRIRHVITEVKEALAELVARGMVVERIGRDGRVHYCLKARKRAAVARFLSETIPPRRTSLPSRPPSKPLYGLKHAAE